MALCDAVQEAISLKMILTDFYCRFQLFIETNGKNESYIIRAKNSTQYKRKKHIYNIA